jgi:putative DNA primase/helicase
MATPRPPTPDFYPENVLGELKAVPRWVVWRYERRKGKWTKPPFRAADGKPASVTRSADWATFEAAKAALNNGAGFVGVGLVLDGSDDLVGWDLDHCLNPKTLEPTAETAEIVGTLKSYTEVTPSGEGFRIILRARLPVDGRKHGGVEVYKKGRYLTITGNRWPEAPATIERRETENAAVFEKFIRQAKPAAVPAADHLGRALANPVTRRLFDGNWKGEYPSQSEADLALCRRLLAFGAEGEVDRWFRQSRLMRPKWDERRGDRTYGQMTLAKAIELAKASSLDWSHAPRVAVGSAPTVRNTELGNARRLVRALGDEIRYSYERKAWLWYDGRRWAVDRTGEVEQRAKRIVEAMHAEAATLTDDDERKALRIWALRSEDARRIKAAVSLAQSELGVPVVNEQLDRDPWLLNVENGTLDLRSGVLRTHDRDDLITKLVPIAYDPAAPAPTWIRFLEKIMAGDADEIRFLQRAVGYSLTGKIGENVMFIPHGGGKNGKSEFLKAVNAIAGDYAAQIPPESLLVQYRASGGAASEDIARLAGARFVWAVETDEGRGFSEAKVKQLTGGDPLIARYLHGHFFKFDPTFKVWYATNFLPTVRGTDEGIWRRLVKVPFTVQISRDERVLEFFENRLRGELPGILAWAVAGCLEWRERELDPPHKVTQATEEYRGEMDVVAAFLAEHALIKPGVKVLAGELYRAYREFETERGESPLTSTMFGRRLTEKGFKQKDSGGKWRLGLSLRAQSKEER